MPATLPIVLAVPISPVAQPRSWRKTPTNGPMPDCMSAMKKLSANRGQIRDVGGRDVIGELNLGTLNLLLPIESGRA